MFKSMKLGTKIGVGFGILLVFIVAFGVWNFILSNSNVEKATHTKEESIVFANYATEMKLAVIQVQQWLTDISATRGVEGLDEGFKKAEVNAKRFKELSNHFRKMYREKNDQQNLNQLEKLGKEFDEYYNMGKKMAEAYVKSGHIEGNKAMKQFDPYAEKITADIEEFKKHQMDELNQSMESVVKSANLMKTYTVIISLVSIAIGVLTCFLITRMITKPINRTIEGLTDGADQVASASAQVSSASQSLAEGASEQAAGLEETSSSIEEMASMTRQNADNANQANILMADASRVIDEANRSMSELTESMREISAASEETAKIIKTIDEIAFQTNLLALNAAVEAARAGEAGAGFAVVADEVRNLAMRAADAAKNTANLVEGTVKKIKNGSDIVSKTNKAFGKVATGVKKVGELVGEISAASNEQTQGVDQINKAVAEMDKVVQKNAASAEESASASEEMNAQAEQMKGFVGELVALVGGQGNDNGVVSDRGLSHKGGNSGPVFAINHQPKTGIRKVLPALPKKRKGKEMDVTTHHKGREIKREQVIPMEEGDFKEF